MGVGGGPTRVGMPTIAYWACGEADAMTGGVVDSPQEQRPVSSDI